jgi:hypothetical protein
MRDLMTFWMLKSNMVIRRDLDSSPNPRRRTTIRRKIFPQLFPQSSASQMTYALMRMAISLRKRVSL